MRLALISLCRQSIDEKRSYCGLLPIGNDSLLAYQIMLAHRAGAETLLCHIDTMPGDLMRHQEMAEKLGLKWIAIRHFGDLLPHIMPEDELLVIGDGLFHSLDVFDDFITHAAPSVLQVPVDDAEHGLERLDLNHFWAGLLLIKREQLDSLGDVPLDWSLESVLLRGGMKGAVQTIMVPRDAGESNALVVVDSDEKSAEVSRDFLGDSVSSLHPFSHYPAKALVYLLAGWLWSGRERISWLLAASAALFLLMVGLVALSWPIVGIVSGYLGYLLGRTAPILDQPVRRRISQLPIYLPMAVVTSAAIGLGLSAVIHWSFGAYIALIWLVMQGLAKDLAHMPFLQRMAFDPLILAVLGVAGVVSGWLGWAIALLTLVQAGCLLIIKSWKEDPA